MEAALASAVSLSGHYRLTANIDAWPTNNATSRQRISCTRPASITYADGTTATPAAYDSTNYALGLTPIGNCGGGASINVCDTGDTPFTGSLEGGGYTIHGLLIRGHATGFPSGNSGTNTGLFGAVSGAGVKVANLHLRAVNITSNGVIGAIAGLISSGVIVQNVSATGRVNVQQTANRLASHIAGGLVGEARGSGTTLRNSYSNRLTLRRRRDVGHRRLR